MHDKCDFLLFLIDNSSSYIRNRNIHFLDIKILYSEVFVNTFFKSMFKVDLNYTLKIIEIIFNCSKMRFLFTVDTDHPPQS